MGARRTEVRHDGQHQTYSKIIAFMAGQLDQRAAICQLGIQTAVCASDCGDIPSGCDLGDKSSTHFALEREVRIPWLLPMLMKTVFTARALYTPIEEARDPIVVGEGGAVASVSSRARHEIPACVRLVDFAVSILAPGFVDIHIHGGAGLDVMLASPAGLPRLGKFLASRGVTGYFPLIGAASPSTPNGDVLARPLGIHLEGPFLSHKRRGVHPPENLIEPTVEIFERLWQAARGHVSVITIAPELRGAMKGIAGGG